MSKLKSNRLVDTHATKLMSGFRDPALVGVSKIWPIIDVENETGKFFEFGADASVVRQNLERALGEERKRIDVRVGSGSFSTEEVSIEIPMYDRELRNVPDSRKQRYRDQKARTLAKVHLLALEYTVANSYLRNAAAYDASYTTALTGTNQWKDKTNSTPFKNMRDWLRAISFVLGVPTSELSIALAPKPWEALQDHPESLDRTKYTGKEMSPEWLAGAVNCKSVDLLMGMYASTFDPDNPKNTVFSNIYDDEVIVYLEINDPGVGDPLWGGVARVDGYPIATEYREEPISADIMAADDNTGIFQHSNKRGFLARTVSGLT